MIIRISLSLLGLAGFIFVILIIVYHFHLILLSGLLMLVAVKIWLLGSFLLCSAGLVKIIRSGLDEIMSFFAISARVQRRLWFNYQQYARLKQLYRNKAQYLDYVSEIKRHRLLRADNHKAIQQLTKLIKADMLNLKPVLPETTLKHFQQQLKNYAKHHDLDSLVKLQHQLTLYH